MGSGEQQKSMVKQQRQGKGHGTRPRVTLSAVERLGGVGLVCNRWFMILEGIVKGLEKKKSMQTIIIIWALQR